MPSSAVIHIQNSAPGPPRATAVATPAILPVPMVADSEVISALKGEISPSPLPLVPCSSSRRPVGMRRMVMKRRPILR